MQVLQNWWKDLSVVAEAGTSWLIVLTQFQNSSKLAFILFVIFSAVIFKWYIFLKIVQDEWWSMQM